MKELSNRSFGLEFEMVNRHSWEYYSRRVQRALQAFPNAARFKPTGEYGHSDGRQWEFKSDSSCGWELVTPALRWKDWPQVTAVLQRLNESGAQVNDRCGFHVHHDLRDFKHRHLRRLMLLWMLFEDMMFTTVAPTRQDNEFCRRLMTEELNPAVFEWRSRDKHNLRDTSMNYGHYYALNVDRWWNLGLVEFRLHQGTLNPDEAKRWVLITQSICEMALARPWGKTFTKLVESDVPTKLRLFRTAVRKYQDHPEIMKAATELRERVKLFYPHLLEAQS